MAHISQLGTGKMDHISGAVSRDGIGSCPLQEYPLDMELICP